MLRNTKTENGLVRGLPAADPRITAYKGIPFAAPPIGNLRWKAPQPALNWDGTRDCFEFAPISMQDTPGLDPDAFYNKEWHVDPEISMSEDCLYLNIWTPAKSTDEKLPVMVWIFGGGLQGGYTGEMEFDGERIARRGVILVSVNYRVNVFGFLSHPDITAEDPGGVNGNWGILDQKAGIDWVGRNIANFGGDPKNITVFGQSGGGRSVLAHLTSPMAKGSFHKCIAESCGAVRVWAPKGLEREYPDLKEAEEIGQEFFEFSGVKSLTKARALDAKELLLKNNEFGKLKDVRMGCFGFTIDGKYVAEDPTEVFLSGQHHEIPFIMGLTTTEFCMGPKESNNEYLEAWAKENFGNKSDEFLALCREKAGDDAEKTIEAAKVSMFDISVRQCMEQSVKRGDKNIYMYRFGPEIPGDNAGAFHSSDLWFQFETLAKCWRPFTGKHYDLARQICNYWTNFAKSGNPNGPDHDGVLMPEWTPYTSESPRAIEFLETPLMQQENPDNITKWLVDLNMELNCDRK